MNKFFSSVFEHIVSFDNNSLVIRFFLALMVLISHTFAIYGVQEPSPLIGSHSLGWYAVNGFFFISGLLVAQSFLHRTPTQYFAARGLRILPAYIAALILALFLTGLYGKENCDFTFIADGIKFFISNILPLSAFHPGMTDVWTTSAVPNSLNNSAWTIPFEVFCYLFIIPLLLGSMQWLIKILIAGSSLYFLFQLGIFGGSGIIAFDLVRTLIYFAFGTSLYLVFKQQKINSYMIMALLLIIGVDAKLSEIVVDMALFAIILFSFYYKNIFGIHNDYSYGMYIYAWPITQAVHSLVPDSVEKGLIITCMLTYLASIASWHYLEKPILKMKNKIPAFILAPKE